MGDDWRGIGWRSLESLRRRRIWIEAHAEGQRPYMQRSRWSFGLECGQQILDRLGRFADCVVASAVHGWRAGKRQMLREGRKRLSAIEFSEERGGACADFLSRRQRSCGGDFLVVRAPKREAET